MIKTIFGTIGGILGVFAVVIGLSFFSYGMYAYFGPKYRLVDSKIFHESEQYNEGMIRDLSELQRQYVTADEAGKAALKPIIIHRFAVYPEEKMPSDLRYFYNSIK